MELTKDGNVGIGTAPAKKLHVFADSGTTTIPIVLRLASRYFTGSDPLFFETNRRLDFEGTSVHAVNVDNSTYTTLALNPNGGSVGVGVTSATGSARLHVRSSDIVMFDTDFSAEDVIIEDAGQAWLGLYSDNVGGVGSGITFAEKESGSGTAPTKWAIFARTQGNVGDLVFTRGTNANPGANEIMMQLLTDGTTKVQILEITGADIAERFAVTDRVEPGMVVEIDPDHPGQLRLAHGAYNRRVAGVVSGAGDLPVGAILGNLPGCEDAPPIALSGRVWAYCDASNGAIQPGDMLTTSRISGHAMKVEDYALGQGAIIGKAMTTLESGRGLVLVLVNLQ